MRENKGMKYLISEPSKYFDSKYANVIIPDTTFLFEHTDNDVDWFKENHPKVYLMEDVRLATKPEFDPGLLLQKPKENGFQGAFYFTLQYGVNHTFLIYLFP